MGSPGSGGRFRGCDVVTSRVDLLMTSWYHDEVGPARCSSTLPSLTTAKEDPFTMANQETITIPLVLPFDEAAALAQFVKRIDYETCAKFAAVCWTYGNRAESDVMWSAVCLLQRQLAEAGFAPR
jgi:hypothetical protein